MAPVPAASKAGIRARPGLLGGAASSSWSCFGAHHPPWEAVSLYMSAFCGLGAPRDALFGERMETSPFVVSRATLTMLAGSASRPHRLPGDWGLLRPGLIKGTRLGFRPEAAQRQDLSSRRPHICVRARLSGPSSRVSLGPALGGRLIPAPCLLTRWGRSGGEGRPGPSPNRPNRGLSFILTSPLRKSAGLKIQGTSAGQGCLSSQGECRHPS